MHAQLTRCRDLLRAATAGLDDETASVRRDGRWSIAEIVEHLDRTYTGTTKGFERCLASGETRVTPASLRTRLRRFAVVTVGYFPTGIPAPRHVVPAGETSLAALLSKVDDDLAALDAAANAVRQRFGGRPVLDHPILGPFDVDHWLRFHYVHTRHHQKQILARRPRP